LICSCLALEEPQAIALLKMIYEVQTYDNTDNTVYYETVEDAIDYEDARDVIAEKYPNRKVLAVIGKNK
jgi:hypothetical protein